jgi:hypothetical protein
MVQMDNLLVHMHAFNLYPAYYKIPRDLAQKIPFFEMRNGKIYVANAFNKAKYREFAQFWLPICVINESMWLVFIGVHTFIFSCQIIVKEKMGSFAHTSISSKRRRSIAEENLYWSHK